MPWIGGGRGPVFPKRDLFHNMATWRNVRARVRLWQLRRHEVTTVFDPVVLEFALDNSNLPPLQFLASYDGVLPVGRRGPFSWA